MKLSSTEKLEIMTEACNVLDDIGIDYCLYALGYKEDTCSEMSNTTNISSHFNFLITAIKSLQDKIEKGTLKDCKCPNCKKAIEVTKLLYDLYVNEMKDYDSAINLDKM